MNFDNPYAPPETVEPEAISDVMWRTTERGVMARHGAILPAVDLETGECEEEMKYVTRSYAAANLFIWLCGATAAVILIIAFAQINKTWAAMIAVFFLLVGLGIGIDLAGKKKMGSLFPPKVVIVEFLSQKTSEGRGRRKRLRVQLALVVVALLFFVFLLSPMSSLGDFLSVIFKVFLPGVVCLLGLGIWAIMDGSKTRNCTCPAGWIHISPIHPQAWVCLANAERENEIQPLQLKTLE